MRLLHLQAVTTSGDRPARSGEAAFVEGRFRGRRFSSFDESLPVAVSPLRRSSPARHLHPARQPALCTCDQPGDRPTWSDDLVDPKADRRRLRRASARPRAQANAIQARRSRGGAKAGRASSGERASASGCWRRSANTPSSARHARSASSSCTRGTAEHGHDRVADELLHGSSVGLDDALHPLEVAGEYGPEGFRVG